MGHAHAISPSADDGCPTNNELLAYSGGRGLNQLDRWQRALRSNSLFAGFNIFAALWPTFWFAHRRMYGWAMGVGIASSLAVLMLVAITLKETMSFSAFVVAAPLLVIGRAVAAGLCADGLALRRASATIFDARRAYPEEATRLMRLQVEGRRSVAAIVLIWFVVNTITAILWPIVQTL